MNNVQTEKKYVVVDSLQDEGSRRGANNACIDVTSITYMEELWENPHKIVATLIQFDSGVDDVMVPGELWAVIEQLKNAKPMYEMN